MTGTAQQPIVQSGPPVADLYEQIAYTKLWALLPEVYRAADATELDGPGPLQELCRRLAQQVAVVRRSLDRLWEDQSIEGCEDWVIPYIAALLDTNLVPAMDARGQRLDVANTINYRRRKGTLGLIEQLAADVTGWESRAIEFFRRLTRRRHLLDPAIGRPADAVDPAAARQLQLAEMLVGKLSGTPAGGYADLRSATGAAATGSAFDEFSHRVDVRPGRGALGWYTISKLGLFLWRSPSIPVPRATPVQVANCQGYFSFDPTGRQIALWQADNRPAAGYGEGWVSIEEWEVPGPIDQLVYDAILALCDVPVPRDAWPERDASLWPGSLSVSELDAGYPVSQDAVTVWTDVGRLKLDSAVAPVEVSYHYGLPGLLGAGPYDRRQACVTTPPDPQPVTEVQGGSATALHDALLALGSAGTVVLTDGLTSTAVADLGSAAAPISNVCVHAIDESRAVIRQASGAAPWVFEGPTSVTGTGAQLRLEALLLSGFDVVLRGYFEQVTITCCTFDPGTAGDLRTPQVTWEPAVDGQALSPTRLWIEGTVKSLVIERSVLGPIRTRQGGKTESIEISDSIVQGLPSATGPTLTADQIFDGDGLVELFHTQPDPLTAWLATQLSAASENVLATHQAGTTVSAGDLASIALDLQAVIDGPSIWDPPRFADRTIPPELVTAAQQATGPAVAAANADLLRAAFPVQLGDAAVATETGITTLCRSTMLGRGYVHQLYCSESILDDWFVAADDQDGCVRFSAWAQQSVIPRKYESVQIAAGSPIFESRRFGESFFGQLSGTADAEILQSSTAGPPSIRAGSHDGSEMGAFCSGAAAVKERSLLIKLDEYTPVGLTPVLIPMPPFDATAETKRGRPWPPQM